MADHVVQRRGFLRALASLPLIGGSVALIGRPTAAAVPVTPEVRDRYLAWLANEHAAAMAEMDPAYDYRRGVTKSTDAEWAFIRARAPLHCFPNAPDVERAVRDARPSMRAAVVLSAAGVALIPGDGA